MLTIPTTPLDRTFTDVDNPRPCYVIQLCTALRDEETTLDLVDRISNRLSDLPEIYEYSTTIGLEGDPNSQHRVYVDVVAQPAPR